MPKNVRNFWINIDVDGRKSALASGPVSKDGGIYGHILMRDKGNVVTAVTLQGRVNDIGEIILDIDATKGLKVETFGNGLRIKTVR